MSLTLEIPKNLPDPFVCCLSAERVGRPLVLAHNQNGDFHIVFPSTAALTRKLNGRRDAFFSSRLISGVLVFGPEVDGWAGNERVTGL